jgi:hypothetical protein
MKGFETHHRFCDFLNEAVILFNPIVQIVNLANLNKTQQTCKHQQDINVLQPSIVGAAFIHHYFFRQSVNVDRLSTSLRQLAVVH